MRVRKEAPGRPASIRRRDHCFDPTPACVAHVGCPIHVPSRVITAPVLPPAITPTGAKMPKYLFLQRSIPGKSPQPPSPAQMQEMFAAFNAWKEKFTGNIVDMGGKLRPGGAVVTTSGATDGPFVEAKEIVGGYMLVSAETLEAALAVARESPGVMPGSSVEVREIEEMPRP